MMNIYDDIYENVYHTALLKLALRRQKTKTVYAKCACLQARHAPGPRLPSMRILFPASFMLQPAGNSNSLSSDWLTFALLLKFHLLFSKLFSFVLGSLIFIFSIIWTLHCPDHSAQSPSLYIKLTYTDSLRLRVTYLWWSFQKLFCYLVTTSFQHPRKSLMKAGK